MPLPLPHYHYHITITVTDTNECAKDNGGCEQDCINTQGSFRCYCQDGYELMTNNRGCLGRHSCKLQKEIAVVAW